MRWQVGDVAICVDPGSRAFGMEVEIISNLQEFYSSREDRHYFIGHRYNPGIPAHFPHNSWASEPQHFEPLPDGNQASTWEQCIFKPKELVTYE